VSEFILLVHLAATLVMVGVIWFVQVVHYTRLSNGFDAVTHRRLVRCNWLRTVAWTGRGILVLAMVGAA
jgi:hypothetical protein